MIVFDLDGTLALDGHRNHLLKQHPKRWDEYFDLCDKDELCLPVAQILHALRNSDSSIELWTGRSDRVYDKTIRWLKEHQIAECFDFIRMRPEHDRTQDAELKRQWLHKQRATGDPVILAFEDRARVVAMWRSEGIVCCQVAPGEF